jgi:hypothetical protein
VGPGAPAPGASGGREDTESRPAPSVKWKIRIADRIALIHKQPSGERVEYCEFRHLLSRFGALGSASTRPKNADFDEQALRITKQTSTRIVPYIGPRGESARAWRCLTAWPSSWIPTAPSKLRIPISSGACVWSGVRRYWKWHREGRLIGGASSGFYRGFEAWQMLPWTTLHCMTGSFQKRARPTYARLGRRLSDAALCALGLVLEVRIAVAARRMELIAIAQSQRRTAIKLPLGNDITSRSTFAQTFWMAAPTRAAVTSINCIIASARCHRDPSASTEMSVPYAASRSAASRAAPVIRSQTRHRGAPGERRYR